MVLEFDKFSKTIFKFDTKAYSTQKMEIIEIKLEDKRENSITTMQVEKLNESTFKMISNDIFNCKLNFGTEFQTRINKKGNHEIIRITKKSDFERRTFMTSREYSYAENKEFYEIMGTELVKNGGMWYIDFGGIVTVNIPKNTNFNFDNFLGDFKMFLTEIVDDE